MTLSQFEAPDVFPTTCPGPCNTTDPHMECNECGGKTMRTCPNSHNPSGNAIACTPCCIRCDCRPGWRSNPCEGGRCTSKCPPPSEIDKCLAWKVSSSDPTNSIDPIVANTD